jgi:hypothetical protein
MIGTSAVVYQSSMTGGKDTQRLYILLALVVLLMVQLACADLPYCGEQSCADGNCAICVNNP